MNTLIVTLLIASVSILHASQAGKELNDADSQLNQTYKQLLSTVTDDNERQLLVASQREWLKYRDKNISFFATRYPYSKGGLFFNIHLIQERTKFLESLIENPPEKDAEGFKPSGYVTVTQETIIPVSTTASGTVATPTTLGSPKADFSLTAEDFYKEFQNNNAAAYQKYKGKLVSITGWTESIEPTQVTIQIVVNAMGFGILFNFDDKDTAALPNLSAKKRVSIIGNYSGKTMHGMFPIFDHCQVETY